MASDFLVAPWLMSPAQIFVSESNILISVARFDGYDRIAECESRKHFVFDMRIVIICTLEG
ncbi:hypothetical protein E7747_16235 (plasmid) [Duncaniella dubosii]|uniref:Uncharacterized protein n=1 Tax=Duncaniella dubosii TaxID=2518971 RepID=A0A4P7W6M3_9BACT|nr:hypothetical protein [Duncaniella dubosii]QCD43799.1 hypothetical protein E7747_16235 [Duncaniella dubosii]